MEGHAFNFIEHFFGATEENLHVWTAGLMALVLTLVSILLYPRLKKAAHSVVPDAKITLRSLVEMFVEMVAALCDDIIGHGGRKYLPFVGTIFLFIFSCNLIGLVPGFLPATENWATGAAVATIVFISFNYFGFREHGWGYFKHFTAPISLAGASKFVVAIVVLPLALFQCLFGTIELISMCLRPVTLSIRLFVNITADHTVAAIFSGMAPWLVPIPFLVLGLLVCFLQALIFTLLTIVYISLATAHDH